MLDLAQVKAFLRVTTDEEDDDISSSMLEVAAAFRVQSKRRWPVVGEPALMAVIDPLADPVEYRFVRWTDPAVLSADEQLTADRWIKFTLGHWHENRQTVAVGVSLTEVPETARKLMNLLREPTI